MARRSKRHDDDDEDVSRVVHVPTFRKDSKRDFDSRYYDQDDAEVEDGVAEWADSIRSKVDEFAEAIITSGDDVDFSATLQQLGVMEKTGPVRRFALGVLRVNLQKKLSTAEYRLRKYKLVRALEIRKELEAGDEKVGTEADRKALVAGEDYTEKLELRVINLEYKIGLINEAIISLSERNKLIPGIQGQRRGQEQAQQSGARDSDRRRNRERE